MCIRDSAEYMGNNNSKSQKRNQTHQMGNNTCACRDKKGEDIPESIKPFKTTKSLDEEDPEIKQIFDDHKAIYQRLQVHEQDHLISKIHLLPIFEAKSLILQLEDVNFEQADALLHHKLLMMEDSTISDQRDEQPEVQPLNELHRFSQISRRDRLKLRDKGLNLIFQRKVAIVVLAGGECTRMTNCTSKGTIDFGLPSGKGTFQLMIERIRRLESLVRSMNKIEDSLEAKAFFRIYIMTNDSNHRETQKHFEKNKNFGYFSKNIFFMKQEYNPIYDEKGKFMLLGPSKLATSVNGSGGVFTTLFSYKGVEHMKQNGIEYVHFIGAENPLGKVADPVFLGFVANGNYDSVCKVVHRENPDEQSPFLCKINDRITVVDPDNGYRDFYAANWQKKNKKQDFVYKYRPMIDMITRLDCLDKRGKLWTKYHGKYYRPIKISIPYYDPITAQNVSPSPGVPNAYKFKLRFYDIFAFFQNFEVLEVDAEDEYAPLVYDASEANRLYSLTFSKKRFSAAHRKMLTHAKVKVVDGDKKGEENNLCEISPLVAYDEEDVHKFAQAYKNTVTLPCWIENDQLLIRHQD
eukprot:TRINITY_DN10332_c0_g1_i1.p1 TRINITY_DN10332_c0_g1~~TRINITY_DN10332_c0_g1_i1.p1  ORF type:complete len:577 (+),score=108.53 TRINITY_DN10332_c0_g1_i1:64-1794(+)